MAVPRMLVSDFALKNPYYAGASVTIYTIDDDLEPTATKATLYAASTGVAVLTNPQDLDSQGKFAANVYVDRPVVCSVVTAGASPETSELGVIGLISRWRGIWTTATIYYPGERVREPAGPSTYVVAVAHTSGTFATDVGAGLLEAEIDGLSIALGVEEQMGVVTPERFGALGNGVADDTAAIQAAINSLATTGGVVRFKPATYVFTALTVPTRGVRLVGTSRVYKGVTQGTRLIYSGSATGNWVTLSSGQCSIEDINFVKGSGPLLAGGYAIACTLGASASRTQIKRVWIDDPFNGVLIEGHTNVLVEDVFVRMFTGPVGVHTRGDAVNITSLLYYHRAITQAAATNTTGDGWVFEGNVATLYAKELYAREGWRGYSSIAAGGDEPQFLQFFRCSAEVTGGNGFHMGAASFPDITECYSSICHGRGIYVGAGCIGTVTITNCDVRANDLDGLYFIAGNYRAVLANNRCGQNGVSAPDTFYGIFFTAGCANFQINGGVSGGNVYCDTAVAGAQKYGLAISAGCSNYTVQGLDLRGNTTGAAILNGTTGQIINCPGFKQRAYGTATGVTPNGAGNVTITHGLGTACTWAKAAILGDTGSTGVQVQSIGATTIVVRIYNQSTGADITSGTYDVSWEALGASAAV